MSIQSCMQYGQVDSSFAEAYGLGSTHGLRQLPVASVTTCVDDGFIGHLHPNNIHLARGRIGHSNPYPYPNPYPNPNPNPNSNPNPNPRYRVREVSARGHWADTVDDCEVEYNRTL